MAGSGGRRVGGREGPALSAAGGVPSGLGTPRLGILGGRSADASEEGQPVHVLEAEEAGGV